MAVPGAVQARGCSSQARAREELVCWRGEGSTGGLWWQGVPLC